MRTVAFVLLLLVVHVLAAADRPAAAYYGGPRFFGGQASSRFLHNVPDDPGLPGDQSDEYRVTSTGTVTSSIQRVHVTAAVTNWNNALRGAPNSLAKYPLHFIQHEDPTANIIVRFTDHSDMATYCTDDYGRVAPACNYYWLNPATIYVDNTLSSTTLITHELGHSFWFDDQYYAGDGCSPATTVMDCESIQENPDETDFRLRYRPAGLDSNPFYPDSAGSTWNAVYVAGNVILRAASKDVEYLYYWDKRADTGGARIADYYTATNAKDKQFDFGLASRFCVFSQVYNEAGWAYGDQWSPRSQYTCVGAAQSQAQGFLLSTSDRPSSVNNDLYIRIKNFTGGTRNVAIFGPALQDIGCGYQNLSYLSTRTCSISIARGAYTQLVWFAFNGPNDYSYGYLDFE